MACCKAARSVIKTVLKRKILFRPQIISTRDYKESRWKGYYKSKLEVPLYNARKEHYRENVMKTLELMPNLEQKLKELDIKDPILDATVDIGLPSASFAYSISPKERAEWKKELRSDKELERKALENQLKVNLNEVHKVWQRTNGPLHQQTIAEHYGLYTDLFKHGTFIPWIPLDICYAYDDDSVTPINMGNILEAGEAEGCPEVRFESKPEDLWTLVFTNLDGHLLDTNSEYLHWFVGNIKGNDLKTGEIICDYLRPFPMRGTGYHRMAFVLYKQDRLINFSSLRRKSPCHSLKERTFKTFDFYKAHQDDLTPAGLAFFQCIWDPQTTDFFHKVLNMQEPVFEYNDVPREHCPQEQFPHKKPFNIYLDRYRDPKEIKKEVLLKRLKTIHPFEEEPPMPKFPCLHKPDTLPPSWLKDDLVNERMRLGKYRDLRPHSVYPHEDNQGSYTYKA